MQPLPPVLQSLLHTVSELADGLLHINCPALVLSL